MTNSQKVELAIAFKIGVIRGCDVEVWKCEGYRLPVQPFMWAVRHIGAVLDKDGDWEVEPQPSSRDDEFYDRARFDTFAEALESAVRVIDASGGIVAFQRDER
jgi:hypothetical protein